MAFSLKTWVNRISEYPNRRKLTHEDGSTELVTVARAEGQISAEGNAFSAEEMNDLENRIKGGFDEVNRSLTDSIPQILTKCEEIKSAVDAISSTSLPNPLSLQVNGNISQKINYPFGTGTMEANASCNFPLSVFWTLGYKKCLVNGKEYNTSTANVSLSLGNCRKGDGIAGSTSGKQSNTLVFSY